MRTLARSLRKQGRASEAEPLARRCYEIRARSLGEEHPDTLRATNDLAHILRDLGRVAEAEPLDRRCYEISLRTFG